MVCRRVEHKSVCVGHHHLGNHTAHLLATGEHRCLFQHLLAREQHFSEESFQIDFARVVAVLAQPVDKVQVSVEERGVVERQISRSDCLSPVVSAGVGLAVAVDDFKQSGHGARVVAKEHHLVVFLNLEVYVVEEQVAVLSGFQALHLKNLVARLTVGRENDSRIAARRWLDFLYIEFLEHLLAACSLLRLSHIGAESLDKLHQLLALFLCLLVGLLLLAESQLARLIPETVVAGKQRYLVVVDVEGVGRHGVEEVTVVAHNEHRVLAV